jgi:Zn-dependent M28 family amino/carboxypeptidase
MDIPWSRMSLNRTHPSMTLVGAQFDDAPTALLSAVFNPDYADLLFSGTGHSFAEIAALGKDRKPLPTFPLPVGIRATTHVVTRDVESNNLVAVIPGADPALRNQYVVLSAHLDHLGIGAPINGDRINHGAMDNASGCALLLDIARSLKASHQRLRRSVLFVWVTGEEKGLLGSRLFATRPTVAVQQIVADINTDMFLPIVPLKVVTVYGLGESDLGDRITAVAKRLGVRVQPDPEPLRNLFIRSDQYSFIKQGIPSLAMKVGFDEGSTEETLFKRWLTERYHAPSDDAEQPVDLGAAADFEELVRGLTVDVANDTRSPAWKADSFFRRYTAGKP